MGVQDGGSRFSFPCQADPQASVLRWLFVWGKHLPTVFSCRAQTQTSVPHLKVDTSVNPLGRGQLAPVFSICVLMACPQPSGVGDVVTPHLVRPPGEGCRLPVSVLQAQVFSGFTPVSLSWSFPLRGQGSVPVCLTSGLMQQSRRSGPLQP